MGTIIKKLGQFFFRYVPKSALAVMAKKAFSLIFNKGKNKPAQGTTSTTQNTQQR